MLAALGCECESFFEECGSMKGYSGLSGETPNRGA